MLPEIILSSIVGTRTLLNMKTTICIALLACMVAMISADCVYTEGNGQPQCTAENVKIQIFRNNWDPTHYWVCDTVNQPAKSVECESGGYMESANACVAWNTWTWTDPCDPQDMVAN